MAVTAEEKAAADDERWFGALVSSATWPARCVALS